jgi:hypothetical protein
LLVSEAASSSSGSDSPHQGRFDRLKVQSRMRVVHVHIRDVMRQSFVVLSSRRIEDQKQYVETREKRGGQVDVLDRRDLGIVSTV